MNKNYTIMGKTKDRDLWVFKAQPDYSLGLVGKRETLKGVADLMGDKYTGNISKYYKGEIHSIRGYVVVEAPKGWDEHNARIRANQRYRREVLHHLTFNELEKEDDAIVGLMFDTIAKNFNVEGHFKALKLSGANRYLFSITPEGTLHACNYPFPFIMDNPKTTILKECTEWFRNNYMSEDAFEKIRMELRHSKTIPITLISHDNMDDVTNTENE